MAGEPTMMAKCTAEFIGTFLLVLVVGCNILDSDVTTWAGVSIALVLMACIYALGGISGANFNPAVSVSLGISRQLGGPGLDLQTVLVYCGVQSVAAFAAALCYTSLFWDSFSLEPSRGFGWKSAGAVEMIYTFMWCFVVLNVGAARKNVEERNQYYGLAISFVVLAGSYGGGAVSGGCFNPAMAIGVDASSGRNFGYCLSYIFFQLLGAALAAFAFALIRPEDFGAERTIIQKLLSEFVGTYILIFTLGLNVLAQSSAAAFSVAACLMSLTYALADVSGAHFNPAVTAAVLISGREVDFPPLHALLYALTQLVAGLAAVKSYTLIYTTRTYSLGPYASSYWGQVCIAEPIFTFLLCYVFLAVAVSERTKASHMFGLAIGSCLMVGASAISNIAGFSMNPAFSIPSTLLGLPEMAISKGLTFTALELAGGTMAAVVFKLTHEVDSLGLEGKAMV